MSWYEIIGIAGGIFLFIFFIMIASAPDKCSKCPHPCKNCPYDEQKHYA